MKSLISTFALFLILTACNDGGEQVKLLEDQVMAVHDEVMPKSEKLMDLKKKLGEIAVKDSTQKAQVTELSMGLQAADDAMMDWMAAYQIPDGDDTKKESYLKEQKTKIEGVKTKINSSIENAEAFLKK